MFILIKEYSILLLTFKSRNPVRISVAASLIKYVNYFITLCLLKILKMALLAITKKYRYKILNIATHLHDRVLLTANLRSTAVKRILLLTVCANKAAYLLSV